MVRRGSVWSSIEQNIARESPCAAALISIWRVKGGKKGSAWRSREQPMAKRRSVWSISEQQMARKGSVWSSVWQREARRVSV